MKKFLLLLFILNIFVFPKSIYAFISKPYTLDIKDMVIFGDTRTVDGHRGLQNYTQNYVNGFAHFTFTYTHERNYSSNYPPSAYITNVDPMSTSTPIEKMLHPVVDAPSLYWYGETDWYLVDVQFDALGLRTIIKQRGQTEISNIYTEVEGFLETDFVSIANRYPWDAMFPDSLQYAFAFAPVSVKEPVPEVPDPVIIIPGIMGSAYKNNALVIDPILHTYDDLISTLKANGYVENSDLFTFPYEWRDSNVLNAKLLKNKINEVKSVCACEEVDLVAHSMGGLLARQYIQSDEYDEDVDQIIFLGTPHKGAPESYLRFEAGEFENGSINFLIKTIFEEEARRRGFKKGLYGDIFSYVKNRPIKSIEELLPIFDYLKDAETGSMLSYGSAYPQNTFLENLNNNVDKLLNSDIEITNIIGETGANTIEKINIIQTNKDDIWVHGEPKGFYNDNEGSFIFGIGDDTVPTIGSTLDSSIQNIISNNTHGRLPTVEANRIYNILTGKESVVNIDNGFELSPIVLIMQLQSPIDFVIIAPDGKRIGKNFETGGEYAEISNAFYSGFEGEIEYITILNPVVGEYKIELQGTGEGGEFGVKTTIINGEKVDTDEYKSSIKTGEIISKKITTDPNTDSINIEIEKDIVVAEVVDEGSGRSGSSRRNSGEVLGAFIENTNTSLNNLVVENSIAVIPKTEKIKEESKKSNLNIKKEIDKQKIEEKISKETEVVESEVENVEKKFIKRVNVKENQDLAVVFESDSKNTILILSTILGLIVLSFGIMFKMK